MKHISLRHSFYDLYIQVCIYLSDTHFVYFNIARISTDCHNGLLFAKYSSVATKIVPSSFATITLALSRSFSIIFIHVNFCPPLRFFTYFRTFLNAVFAGVLSGSLKTCPYQFNLLSFIFLLHSLIFILSHSSLLDILLGHLVLRILRRRFPWKAFIVFSSFLCITVIYTLRHSCRGYLHLNHILIRYLFVLGLISWSPKSMWHPWCACEMNEHGVCTK